ncbi:hypothetical protein AVEN_49340-1 [Araneus ventricosus]|uniref:Uncharacterized protein n=1 Tax=Araneus ventricosus TaxID=182803 RepID=A0A4Y2H8Y9_ARAVE|nr:hypothetical protein AVEN_49340-1 [Araneus ventricosus]
MKDGALFPNIRKIRNTGTIALVQISNANSQQFTSTNSNSTFRFSNTNSQQFTNNDSNSTFNSAQLTGFPARNADECPKFFFLISTYSREYPSAARGLPPILTKYRPWRSMVCRCNVLLPFGCLRL